MSPARRHRSVESKRDPTASGDAGAPLRPRGDRATATRILDAAEVLFAEHGFDAVSVRSIMKTADAQLGLLSYHFGTKEALLEAVVSRRAQMICEVRLRALHRLAATATIEDLMAAYLGSPAELFTGSESGWGSYYRLLAQLTHSDRWPRLFEKYLLPTSILFIERLHRFAPDVPHSSIMLAWIFGASSALGLAARGGRADGRDGGGPDGAPSEADTRALITFVSGGLRAVLGLPSSHGTVMAVPEG